MRSKKLKLKRLQHTIEGQQRAHELSKKVDAAFPPEQRQIARLVGGLFAGLCGDQPAADRLLCDYTFQAATETVIDAARGKR